MRPNPQETADSVTFTEEILNGKLTFCTVFLIWLSQNKLKNNPPYLCYEPSSTTENKNLILLSWNILTNSQFYQKRITVSLDTYVRLHTHNIFREIMAVSLQFCTPHW